MTGSPSVVLLKSVSPARTLSWIEVRAVKASLSVPVLSGSTLTTETTAYVSSVPLSWVPKQ